MNDLTNRELIRRKFTFSEPGFHKIEKDGKNEVNRDDAPEDEIHEGSLVFDMDSESKKGPSKDLTSQLENRKQYFDRIGDENYEDDFEEGEINGNFPKPSNES